MNLKESHGGGESRYAWEHIIHLSEALARHNTRFIYVALPCKKQIYPELVSSSFIQGSSTAPQYRAMIFKLLQAKVEVIDVFPIFMQHKFESHLFDFGHNISTEGANLTAQIIANYLKETSIFDAKEAKFQSYEKLRKRQNRLYKVNFITKDEKPYVPYNQNLSKICIFGNCNLQAFHREGAGIAANLAYYLNEEVDYIGRKLIFINNKEKFDKNAFEECKKRDLAICISFLSGSFVRSSCVGGKKINAIKKFLTNRKNFYGKWSDTTL